MTLGAIVLAGGAAKRMGRAKMLLPFKQTTILAQILKELQAVKPVAITVVTGYYHEEISAAESIDQSLLCFNEKWEEGMSSSIRTGLLNLLEKQHDIDSILIIMSDQPFLNKNLLQEMIDQQNLTGKGIVAAQYDGIVGSPVLFNKKYFKELTKLNGDKGAKIILQQNPVDLITIDFELGALDIDEASDYELLQKFLKEKNADR
ncbi:MAG: nucleotidyltransferase family protein [Chitinophagaceae bacterium]|nr:nucleotidyltransferase family protein [Chitinophagaceae bacterium]